MYDSTSAGDIPTTAQVVAGYIDGAFKWLTGDWARFPNAQLVRIAVFPSTNDGDVLDVEQGDATPAQAPAWVNMRRQAGHSWPTVYCSASVLPTVQQEFNIQNIPQPHYWVAEWDNNPTPQPGWSAKQYADPPQSGGHYDLSTTVAPWPYSAVPQPAPVPQPPSGVITVNVHQQQQGSTGQQVRMIQAVVGSIVDGQFGPNTKAAVEHWQSTHGLAVDGVVGPMTWQSLAG